MNEYININVTLGIDEIVKEAWQVIEERVAAAYGRFSLIYMDNKTCEALFYENYMVYFANNLHTSLLKFLFFKPYDNIVNKNFNRSSELNCPH